MPPRAIISVALVFIFALTGSAATLSLAARNHTIQLRSTLKPKIILPAQAATLGTKPRFDGIRVQPITRVRQTPALTGPGQTRVMQPSKAVVRPALVKAAGGF